MMHLFKLTHHVHMKLILLHIFQSFCNYCKTISHLIKSKWKASVDLKGLDDLSCGSLHQCSEELPDSIQLRLCPTCIRYCLDGVGP